MHLFLLALAAVWCATGAHAQPLPTSGSAERALWQITADAGLAGPWTNGYGSLAVQRQVRNALAVGGRIGGFGGRPIPFDDGGGQGGGFAEGFASLGHHGAAANVTLNAGAGLAAVDYSVGFIDCFPEDCEGTGFRGVRPYGLAGLGVSVFVTRAIGVGGDLRVALMEGPANASSGSLGLRVRLAR